jgi:parallel beta-helix repeat protein
MSYVASQRGPAPEAATVPTVVYVIPTIVLLILLLQPPAEAATYYVGGSGCSDSAGVGSSSQPFCTVTAALARYHSAGKTILVRSGTYREQITVPASGASGAPLVIRAASGATVTVDGADEFSSPSKWVLHAGAVYRASSVTWPPKSVRVDGLLLAAYSGDPRSLPDRSWTYVSGEGLYLRYGGHNPGAHRVQVGRRTYGVYISGRSYITIQGLTIVRAGDRGIQVTSSNHVELRGNNISASGRMGVQLKGCTSSLVSGNKLHDNGDHGLSMTLGTTSCTIEKNECYRNAYAGGRSANGIYIYGSSSNTVRSNRLHDNQDTGLLLAAAANNNVCLQNRAWKNGDHGYDHTGVTGNTHIGDVAFGNTNDGFSYEVNSTGHRMYDCIAVDNGLTTIHYDLYVDDALARDSTPTTTCSGTRPARRRYTTVAFSTAPSRRTPPPAARTRVPSRPIRCSRAHRRATFTCSLGRRRSTTPTARSPAGLPRMPRGTRVTTIRIRPTVASVP